jgi:DNA/RNA endonuclease G (NUC1)
MLNYTIGAVKKKKSTAKKKKVSVPASFFKELKAKKAAGKKTRYPSTLPKDKTWKVTTSCSNAGTQLRKTGSTTAAGVLALCRASVKNLQVTQKALKKYAVTKGKLSRKK